MNDNSRHLRSFTMRDQQQWTDEEVEIVRELFGKGATRDQVAERLRRSLGSVRGCMTTHGIRSLNGNKIRHFGSDEEDVVRRMAAEGASAREIAECLGRTRNSIIGFMNRMGISGRKRNVRTAQPQKKRKQKQPRTTIKPSLHSGYVEAVIVPESERRGLLGRADNQCCFPIGDPLKKDFHYCNREREDGKSYCAHHGAVMHGKRKAQSRRVKHQMFEPSKLLVRSR